MSEQCCGIAEAGRDACEAYRAGAARPAPVPVRCRQCGQAGKPVQGKTVKSLLAISLRATREAEYRFCSTPDCRVVYFEVGSAQVFGAAQLRERVYQKEPQAADVKICYCFDYRAGEVRGATPARRLAIIADIEAGIQSGQCACDLRNPQGSCCLGNVRRLSAACHTAGT